VGVPHHKQTCTQNSDGVILLNTGGNMGAETPRSTWRKYTTRI